MNVRTKNITRNVRLTGMLILFLVAFISELLFYTWCRVQCTRLGYEISHEVKRHEQLSTLQNNLRIELAHLKSPDRVFSIAKQKLGLDMPKPEQFVTIP